MKKTYGHLPITIAYIHPAEAAATQRLNGVNMMEWEASLRRIGAVKYYLTCHGGKNRLDRLGTTYRDAA